MHSARICSSPEHSGRELWLLPSATLASVATCGWVTSRALAHSGASLSHTAIAGLNQIITAAAAAAAGPNNTVEHQESRRKMRTRNGA